jgi:phosphopantothenoylcysteine decarboxylase/phosphopantothenate--cysteine ligase
VSGTNSTLAGRKIILGVTGSISAYKSIVLLRLLIKAGAEVQVIMTEAASDFVGTLTFSTISNKPVLSKLINGDQWSQHVHLGMWADLMIIAPASANTIAKIANGFVDNLLTAVYSSAKCPVMIAPAMDLDMWNHPATQKNIKQLKEFGNQIIPVGHGDLASGLVGPGRLAEPEDIFQAIIDQFQTHQELKNKTILITAGPTYEAIDPVRFVGNYSSGKMGIRIAEEAIKMGAHVDLIIGPSKEPIDPNHNLNIIRIHTADEMYMQVAQRMQSTDIFILAAAVADFKPEITATEKIKKGKLKNLNLNLVPTQDIAAFIGANKKDKQFLCGFALETENVVEHAREKMVNKKMNLVVINSPKEEGSAFNHDTNKIMILDNSEKLVSFELKSKKEAAVNILEAIIERIHT